MRQFMPHLLITLMLMTSESSLANMGMDDWSEQDTPNADLFSSPGGMMSYSELMLTENNNRIKVSSMEMRRFAMMNEPMAEPDVAVVEAGGLSGLHHVEYMPNMVKAVLVLMPTMMVLLVLIEYTKRHH